MTQGQWTAFPDPGNRQRRSRSRRRRRQVSSEEQLLYGTSYDMEIVSQNPVGDTVITDTWYELDLLF